MKSIKFYLLAALLILSACSASTTEDNYEIVTFDTSLTCNNCKKTMFNNLPKEKGVVDIKVNVEEKLVIILFNKTETTIEKLADKIYSLGYSTNVIEVKKYSGLF